MKLVSPDFVEDVCLAEHCAGWRAEHSKNLAKFYVWSDKHTLSKKSGDTLYFYFNPDWGVIGTHYLA